MPTITIGEAIASLDLGLSDHETLAICFGGEDGRGGMTTANFRAVADQPVRTNTYFSTGSFDIDTDFSRDGARSGANVRRVLVMPFDFDLYTYMGCSRGEVLSWDNDRTRETAQAMWIDIKAIFEALGVQPYRVDYTGNGLAAFVKVAHHQRQDVEVVRRVHAALVTRFNNIARMKLADDSVKDAGSRIMRLPFGDNVKMETDPQSEYVGVLARRRPENLYRFDVPAYTVDDLAKLAGTPSEPRKPRDIPREGAPVGNDTLDEIITTVRPEWQPGSRHHIALGLSAMMAKAGLPEDQAEYVIASLTAEDDEHEDRARAVQDTYQRYRQGGEVEGYYALRSTLSPSTLEALDTLMSRIWEAQQRSRTVLSVDFTTGRAHSVETSDTGYDLRDYPEPPPEVEYGLVGRYVDLVEPTTEAPRSFHLMCGMALAGALIGRRVGVRWAADVKYPSLFVMLVGPTGDAKKGTTIRRAFETVPTLAASVSTFGVAPPLPFARQTDVGSGPALIEILSDSPNTVLTVEEARNLFDTMRRQNETLRARFLEVWDTPQVMRHKVLSNPKEVANPFLTFVGAIQPDVLDGTITSSDVSSGLLNRILFVYGVSREDRYNPPPVDPQLAHAWWQDVNDAISHYPEGTVLDLSPEADLLGEQWYRTYKADLRKVNDPSDAELRQRHPEYIHRFALIFAVLDRADRIEAVHLQAGIDMMAWLWDGMSRHFKMWGSREYYVIADKIIAALDRAPRKMLKKADLRDRVKNRRRYDGNDITKVLKDMIENGDLLCDDQGYICTREVAERYTAAFGSASKARDVSVKEAERTLAS